MYIALLPLSVRIHSNSILMNIIYYTAPIAQHKPHCGLISPAAGPGAGTALRHTVCPGGGSNWDRQPRLCRRHCTNAQAPQPDAVAGARPQGGGSHL